MSIGGERLHSWLYSLGKPSGRKLAEEVFLESRHLFQKNGIDTEDGRERLIFRMAEFIHNEVGNVADTFGFSDLYLIITTIFDFERLFVLDEPDWTRRRDTSEWWALRDELIITRDLVADFEENEAVIAETLATCFAAVATESPPCREGSRRSSDILVPGTKLDIIPRLPQAIESILSAFAADEIKERKLFARTIVRLERNLLVASGGNPDDPDSFRRTVTPPSKANLPDKQELIQTYLGGTSLPHLFAGEATITIPEAARFEHHHIVAGSGHGKTQTLQYLIAHDLRLVARRQASVIVMDSQGDLIRTIKGLDLVDEDNLVLIDPTDVSFPVCLNLFDVQMERINSYSRLHREQMLNGILELYDFVLGSLLGAEMTQKQSVIFRYVTRLLLHIPDATIHTMLTLFQDGGTQKYRRYIEELEGTARLFFEEEFDSKEFTQTKRQVVRRLYGILENQTFNRMFSHPRSKLDLFSEMNAGKVILINTAKDLLKETGTEIFGRFFIAMITQAAQERAAMPADERIPTFVYIDEAQDYFDENIEIILSQARKYKVGMVMAHQHLDQLSPRLQSAFMSNTSIKFAGGVSAKDARAFAGEMQVPPDFILGQKRGSFAATVRGVTKQAASLSFPFGLMENLPRHSGVEMERLRNAMRQRFAVPIDELDKQERERWTKEPETETAKPENPRYETKPKSGRSNRKPPGDDDYTFDTTPTPDLK